MLQISPLFVFFSFFLKKISVKDFSETTWPTILEIGTNIRSEKLNCVLKDKRHSAYQSLYLSRGMGFPTMWYVQPAKPPISLRIRAVWSDLLLVAWIFYAC